MRALVVMLVAQVALGGALVALAATGTLPLAGPDTYTADAARPVPRATGNRFSGRSAYASVARQVRLGPRPAGSRASRALARRLRRALPHGRFQPVGGGLRNVVGDVRGRDPRRLVLVGAHYDTKDVPGFVGANDGAAATAVVTELSRALARRRAGPTVRFVLFDGEESPAGTPDGDFEAEGLRGSKVAAAAYAKRADAMVLLDFVGERGVRLPREASSDRALWRRLRRSARRAGVGRAFPPGTQGEILDDHTPFLRKGVASIDLIDFEYGCFHRRCDDMSQISARSLDAAGESVLGLLRTL